MSNVECRMSIVIWHSALVNYSLEAISKMVFMQKAAVNVMLSGAKHP